MTTISDFCFEAFEHELAEINAELGGVVRIVARRIDKRVKLEVSWASVGTVPAFDALEFASNVAKAAGIAATHPMNGAEIVRARR